MIYSGKFRPKLFDLFDRFSDQKRIKLIYRNFLIKHFNERIFLLERVLDRLDLIEHYIFNGHFDLFWVIFNCRSFCKNIRSKAQWLWLSW